ncbi:MAG: hypothetical protein ACRCSP_04155 [Rhodoglobus sp.]
MGYTGMSSDEIRRELSHRLRLVLDARLESRDSDLTYQEVSQALAKRGVSLSQARWSYMVNGTGRTVTDTGLLIALSRFFEIDPSFLLGEAGEIPATIQAELHLILALRGKRVIDFAARELGWLSPEKVQLIADIINEDEPDDIL